MGSHLPLSLTLVENCIGLFPNKAFPVYFLVTALSMCMHVCGACVLSLSRSFVLGY